MFIYKCDFVAKSAEFLVIFIPFIGAFEYVNAGGFVHSETIRGRPVTEPVAPEDENKCLPASDRKLRAVAKIENGPGEKRSHVCRVLG